MTSRRSFLAALTALPFIRNLLPSTLVVKDGMNFNNTELAQYSTVIIKNGGTIWFDPSVKAVTCTLAMDTDDKLTWVPMTVENN